MPNWNRISDKTMDRIAKLASVFPAREVAEMCEVSYMSVCKVTRADKLAKAGDVETLKGITSPNIVEWAAKKYGLTLAPAPTPVAEEEPVEETPAKADDNTALTMVKILTALDTINRTLAEMSASLSRMNGRLANIENAAASQIDKDTLNANFNLLFSEMKEAQ